MSGFYRMRPLGLSSGRRLRCSEKRKFLYNPVNQNDLSQPWPRPLAQTPGPDLAWQDAVMESEAFIISENISIPTSRRALRGVGSTSRRPGQAGTLHLEPISLGMTESAKAGTSVTLVVVQVNAFSKRPWRAWPAISFVPPFPCK